METSAGWNPIRENSRDQWPLLIAFLEQNTLPPFVSICVHSWFPYLCLVPRALCLSSFPLDRYTVLMYTYTRYNRETRRHTQESFQEMINTPTIDQLRRQFHLQPIGRPSEIDLVPFLFAPETAAKGVLVEWLVREEGAGADFLALFAGIARCRLGKALVVVDVERAFFPPEAVRMGMRAEGMVIVQPRTQEDAVWAVDQSLRHPEGRGRFGVDRAVCQETRFEDAPPVAVGGGGERGERPVRLAGKRERPKATFADLRLAVEPVPYAARNDRRWRVTPLYQRGGRPGEPVFFEWNDETHLIRTISEVSAGRSSGRAGQIAVER